MYGGSETGGMRLIDSFRSQQQGVVARAVGLARNDPKEFIIMSASASASAVAVAGMNIFGISIPRGIMEVEMPVALNRGGEVQLFDETARYQLFLGMGHAGPFVRCTSPQQAFLNGQPIGPSRVSLDNGGRITLPDFPRQSLTFELRGSRNDESWMFVTFHNWPR
jgi:hypothetical protein